ncbi:MAG: hypothetical protein H8D87_06415 [Deltaproteobacteria bacterium]|nr:hypothetical protein [Candidatus Desulfobacula maris]
MKTELPAQNIESEESLIASLIMNNNCFNDCEYLYPDDFYRSDHVLIYKTMLEMKSRHENIDLSTLWFELKKKKESDIIRGGIAYLVKISETSPVFNTRKYVSIIKECSLTRKIKTKCMQILDSDKYGELLLDLAQNSILDIKSSNSGDNIKAVKDIIIDHIERLEKANITEQNIYYRLGFPRIDNCLKTIGPKLIIIAGRPGAGKTALAVTMSRNLDKMGVNVGFLSIEMSEDEILERWIAIESGLDSSMFGKFNGFETRQIQSLNDAGAILYDSNIKIDSTGSLDIIDVERKCRKLKKDGCQVIFIDQLSQIGNRQIRGGELTALYTENCTRIARLKKEIGIPIFLLCQLNRDMKDRSKKEPILTDLKQSGKIEEDADAVLFVHRPEEYADEHERPILIGKTILNIAKNRSGPKFRDDKIIFNHQTTYFYQGEL